jgi:hypothetical protein
MSGYMEGMGSGYAPADFADAEDDRPSAAYFDFGITNSTTIFTTAVNNMTHRHVHEIRERFPPPAQGAHSSRRRLRDFLLNRMNDILEFAAKPLAKHPTLGPAEILIRKFSRANFQVGHHSIKDIALDGSGVDIVGEINAQLARFPMTLHGYQEATTFLLDTFRESGEEIVRQDSLLQTRLDIFDKVQTRVAGLAEIQVNEQFEPLIDATKAYLEKIFKGNEIEESYTSLIAAYRKFLLLRDILLTRRIIETTLSEPLCSICFSDTIQYVLNPCGHTFCAGCVKRQISQCYICRQSVKDRVKIYIG